MNSEKLIALILSYQTELWDKLRLSDYQIILESVNIECFLKPMDFFATKQYIENRLPSLDKIPCYSIVPPRLV